MQGTNVIVIDPEREYQNLTDSVGGAYIKLSAQSDQKINPFDMATTSRNFSGEVLAGSYFIFTCRLFRFKIAFSTPSVPFRAFSMRTLHEPQTALVLILTTFVFEMAATCKVADKNAIKRNETLRYIERTFSVTIKYTFVFPNKINAPMIKNIRKS